MLLSQGHPYLPLEQKVDAYAASRMTGISAFTKNINIARRRWMITHRARNTIIGCLIELAGLKNPHEDATQKYCETTVKPKNLSVVSETLSSHSMRHISMKIFYVC